MQTRYVLAILIILAGVGKRPDSFGQHFRKTIVHKREKDAQEWPSYDPDQFAPRPPAKQRSKNFFKKRVALAHYFVRDIVVASEPGSLLRVNPMFFNGHYMFTVFRTLARWFRAFRKLLKSPILSSKPSSRHCTERGVHGRRLRAIETLETRQVFDASISGTVFGDINGNGFQDSAELGLAGQTVFLDTNQNGVRDVFTRTYSAPGLPKYFYGSNWNLGSSFPSEIFSSINITDNTGIPIADVNVKVSDSAYTTIAKHSFELYSPNGEITWLYGYSNSGSSLNVTFDDEATTAISSAGSSPTGTYRPRESLSEVDGKLADGTWKLAAYTNSASDLGSSLNTFELTITYAEPITTTNSSGQYRFSGLTNDTYSVGVATNGYLPTNGTKGVYRLDIPTADSSIASVNFGVRPDNANETLGNTRATAIDLGMLRGSLTLGPNAIAAGGDEDWYKFTLDRPAIYGNGISLDFNAELGDLNLSM